MKQFFFKKRALISALFLFFIFIKIFSQTERFVEINAIAELDRNPLKGAVVTLFEGNNKISSLTTSSDGVFNFKLDPDKYYVIEVSKESYISKRIAFDTHIPENETGTWHPEFTISVLKNCAGVDYSALKDPVDVVKFNSKRREFESDKDYATKMRQKIENIYISYENCLLNKYEKLIALADKQFKAKTYEEARTNYEAALEVFPEEIYPKDRINEINSLLGKQENIENLYQKTIAEADALFNQKRYQEALLKFKGAQTLKPQETYPKQKISEIETLLAKNQSEQQQKTAVETQYNSLVSKGTVEMNSKNYTAAKQSFQQALTIKPEDAALKSKIAEIDRLIAEQAKNTQKQEELNKSYTNLIAQADKELASGNFEAAKNLYLQASALKPMEKYPTAKASEIEKTVLANKAAAEKAKTAEKERQYQDLLTQADNLYKTKDYKGASDAYTKALQLKPEDIYPKQRINQINNIVASEEAKKQKDLDAGYQNAIAAAEKAVVSKDYAAAKSFYLQAQQIKPADQVVKTRITEMDNLIALDMKQKQQAQTLQNNYSASIRKADQFFNAKNYDAAKTAYLEAKNIKPDEQYPSLKIQEIDRIISAEQARKQQEIQQGYQSAVNSGNSFLIQKQYQLAKESFQKALTFKPEDTFAKNKISEIDKLVTQEQANRFAFEAKQKEYNAVISKADVLFTSKDYSASKAEYQKAAQIMPDQQYPKQKIQEIDRLITADNVKKQQELQQGYQSAVNSGNSLFSQKQYQLAKESYQKALTYKPDDPFAKNKISEIENIIAREQAKKADQEKKQKEYDSYISKADIFFTAKNYSSAKAEYQKASLIFTDQQYPKQKIQEIDGIVLAEAQKQKDKEAGYQKAMTAGNLFFNQKSYENAKNSFNEALSYKPGDITAKTKVTEIENIIKQEEARKAAEQAKRKQYDDLIASADGFMNAKNYTSAKTNYQKALQILPSETYPSQKITEIDNIIAMQQKQTAEKQALENSYKAAISRADDYFGKKQYDLSKSEYNKASEIKPSEIYPKNKIAEIDKILTQINLSKEKDQNYTLAITEADKFFNEKNYVSAKTSYNKALGIKPAEAYPKNQILKIDKLIAEEQKLKNAEIEKQKQYDLYITQADKLFGATNYVQAKEQYKKALELKPDEEMPKAKIARIDQLLASQTTKRETTTVTQKQESAQKPLLVELNFKNDNERDNYLAELKKKYPQGVTVEVYKEKTKTITRTIVIRAGEAREFREVYFPSWGGRELTLNGKPITQMFYDEQVKPHGGEYYKKFEF